MNEESRVSVDGILCASMQDFWDCERPGAFIVVDVPGSGPHLWANIPALNERGYEHARLPLRPSPGNSMGASWEWDGNRERPTLSPSIHSVGIWHGFLRAGRFESC